MKLVNLETNNASLAVKLGDSEKQNGLLKDQILSMNATIQNLEKHITKLENDLEEKNDEVYFKYIV